MSSRPSSAASARLNETLAAAVQSHQRGELAPAEGLYRQALAIDPRNFDGLRLLGLIAAQSERNEEAAELIGRAVTVNAKVAETHNHLGVVLQRLGRSQDAAAALGRAVALKPDFAEAYNNLGAALRELGRLEEAVAAYACAIRLNPDYAQAHYNLGIALRELGRLEEAIAAFGLAIALQPDYAKAHFNLGVALQELGRPIDALAAIDRSIALNPASAQAWHARSDLKVFVGDDPDIAQMAAMLTSAEAEGLSTDDRIHLEFALGKALLETGDPDAAFAHLGAGNRLKRATFDYDARTTDGAFADIAAAFSRETMHRLAGAGDPSSLPVFVIGMPRSGTTLVEQILASHAQMYGAGELGVLEGVVNDGSRADGYPQAAARLSATALTQLGQAYVKSVSPQAGSAVRVIDKMPINFRFAGLIHLMLPNARIIHCRRNAADTCLSAYTKLFTGRLDFAYDLRELGLYHRAYQALMRHWRTVLPPERFIEIDYETVVADLEGEARRLVAFCGLEWDPACLEFHRTKRRVRTASVNQVRRPIYAGSLGRWRRYADHLAPLLDALQYE